MPLATLISEHVDAVFLNVEHFASTVLRYICGDKDNTASVTGIVTWQPTIVDESRGKGYIRRAELFLNDSVTVTASDAFLIGDNRYEVESLDDVQYGARIVRLIRREPDAKGVRKAGDV